MNLKTHLMIRMALIAALCLVMAASYVLWAGERQVQRDLNRALDLIARQLEAQLIKIAAGFDRPDRFPYLDPLLEAGLPAGSCIRYTDTQGQVTQSSCRGSDNTHGVPAWFAEGYRAIFDPEREIDRDLYWRGDAYGRITIAADAQGQIANAWRNVSALIGLAAMTVLALCVLVYFVMARALRPAREILLGIERLERGDLSARLPQFELIELRKVSAGFNRLAASLEQTIQERAELMRKLVNVQEEERRFLARELHDEFGQCLAAVNAIASGMVHTAERRCPELVGEGERLARIGVHMMDMLRGMLQRLRPIGIEELGLVDSIKGLVAQWRGGRTQIELEVIGNFDHLPEAISVSVYRLVQECLTNVSKHARATQVRIKLERHALPPGASGRAEDGIDVLVEDNGVADASSFAVSPKLGLLGMRERVTALGGNLILQARQSNGLMVRALLPVTAV
ncbi:MAG: HAMP domain-containing protein [Burkholderiales bacterium]|nr:HAMP domain-containing protein [Burkholderiales bacterium]